MSHSFERAHIRHIRGVTTALQEMVKFIAGFERGHYGWPATGIVVVVVVVDGSISRYSYTVHGGNGLTGSADADHLLELRSS
jgi:hypothetical protein